MEEIIRDADCSIWKKSYISETSEFTTGRLDIQGAATYIPKKRMGVKASLKCSNRTAFLYLIYRLKMARSKG